MILANFFLNRLGDTPKTRTEILQVISRSAEVQNEIAIRETELAELRKQQLEQNQDEVLDIRLLIKNSAKHFIKSDILFGNPFKALGMSECTMDALRERSLRISPDDYPSRAASSVILTYNKAGRLDLLTRAGKVTDSLEGLAQKYGNWIYDHSPELSHNTLLRGTVDEAVKHMADATIKGNALIENLTKFSDKCLEHDFLEGKKRTTYRSAGSFLYSNNSKEIIRAEFEDIMSQPNNKQLLLRANDWMEARIRYMEAVNKSNLYVPNLVSRREYNKVMSLKRTATNASIIDGQAEKIERRIESYIVQSEPELPGFIQALERARERARFKSQLQGNPSLN